MTTKSITLTFYPNIVENPKIEYILLNEIYVPLFMLIMS